MLCPPRRDITTDSRPDRRSLSGLGACRGRQSLVDHVFVDGSTMFGGREQRRSTASVSAIQYRIERAVAVAVIVLLAVIGTTVSGR